MDSLFRYPDLSYRIWICNSTRSPWFLLCFELKERYTYFHGELTSKGEEEDESVNGFEKNKEGFLIQTRYKTCLSDRRAKFN